jgi:4'-phosphopantetheinyl transferase
VTLGFDSLARGQVQVWHGRLDETPLPLALAETWLSGEERQRAARFHFERDRRRFVAACLFLRSLLSRYLDCSPSEIVLGSASGGKPVLTSGGDQLCFNLSHSGELAVAAIGHAREVGVDVEFVGPSRRPELLASRVLSSAERAELDATADGAERQRAFLRAWTRKEALLKACGTGIDRDLATVDVGCDGRPDARVITLADQAGASSQWSVVSIHPAPRYVGAVAARGQGLNVISRPYAAATVRV